MKDMKFDIRGNLIPYEIVELGINEFEDNFVKSFEESSLRYEIFSNFRKYLEDFKTEVTPDFKQWLNGSFVTNRRNPKDIDLVNLIDFRVANDKYEILKDKFLNKEALKNYRIDAYLVRIYPQDHPEYGKTRSDLLYWEHWFSNTKINRAKKRFRKGFVELKHSI